MVVSLPSAAPPAPVDAATYARVQPLRRRGVKMVPV
jgi:hypothetical protein